MSKPLRILIVEDSMDDAELILLELSRYGFDTNHKRVDSSHDLKAALLQENWDVVVSDYSMPGFNGLDALKLAREKDADLPFILVSGAIGEDTAVAAMKAGAQDYLMKGHLARLAPVIERELREAEMRRERKKTAQVLQAIVESSGDPIISKSLDSIITSWNHAAEALFGYSAEEMIGQPILKIIPFERAKEEEEILGRLSAGQPIKNYETVRVAKNGRQIPVSLTISPIRDGAGKITGASKIVRDITDRKKAEAELIAWQQELEHRVDERTFELTQTHKRLQAAIDQRRLLEAEIARAVEREQRHLGQELHDGLGQQLTGMGYMLSVLQEKLKGNTSRAQDAARLQTLLQQSILQTRDLAKGFYPVDLERLGLFVALEEIARNAAPSSQVSCMVESDGNPLYSSLKGPLAIQLFRIAQEATHNAVKHARAKRIVIGIATAEGRIILTIKDDGVGFPADVNKSQGMGLRIMQYRAEMVGGELQIRNGSEGGAIVTCLVPNAGTDIHPSPESEDTVTQSGGTSAVSEAAGKSPTDAS
jgi:two-component system, NarL family, sensor histidine kinase UhpB